MSPRELLCPENPASLSRGTRSAVTSALTVVGLPEPSWPRLGVTKVEAHKHDLVVCCLQWQSSGS